MSGGMMNEESRALNFRFNALAIKQKSGVEIVISALQLVSAILVMGGVVWVGDALAREMDAALGEKPLRDRDA
jgi:hypothetical protein